MLEERIDGALLQRSELDAAHPCWLQIRDGLARGDDRGEPAGAGSRNGRSEQIRRGLIEPVGVLDDEQGAFRDDAREHRQQLEPQQAQVAPPWA